MQIRLWWDCLPTFMTLVVWMMAWIFIMVSGQLYGCRLHTIEHKTGNPTIDACFDSDRLDLWRVGIIPDPDRLATEKGKEIARNTDYKASICY